MKEYIIGILLLLGSSTAVIAQAKVQVYGVSVAWSGPTNSGNLPTCTAQLIAAGTACWDPVAGYNVYRALSGSTTYTQINMTLSTTTSFLDTGVVTGQTYDYYVKSVDASSVQSPQSNTGIVSIPVAVLVPSKPTVTIHP